MTKIIDYDWDAVERAVRDIAMKMYKDNWRPDYIVGITRGGLVPAVMLSHMTDIPLQTLCVQLESDELDANTESNAWMAEEAFGYVSIIDRTEDQPAWSPDNAKKILIVDDINRGGDALSWIIADWQAGCMPSDPHWDEVWHGNVRFAAILDNAASLVTTDYSSEEFTDVDQDIWVTFPWER
jgi:hypoxanthine phosphoribosyltransferase